MGGETAPRPSDVGILKSILISVSLTLGLVLLVGLLGLFSKPSRTSLERGLLIEQRDKMRPDMPLAEVDALMAGHPRRERRDGKETMYLGDRRLPRPIAFSVTYDGKPGATEGDYYLEVYFDRDGRLLEKYVGDYWK